MAHDEAYYEAEKKIKQAVKSGAIELSHPTSVFPFWEPSHHSPSIENKKNLQSRHAITSH